MFNSSFLNKKEQQKDVAGPSTKDLINVCHSDTDGMGSDTGGNIELEEDTGTDLVS